MSINLSKGQKISLEKEAGGPINEIMMGLGWDPANGRSSIDLDASCVVFDENNNKLDEIWFRHLKSNDGNIKHSGDNLTGDGDGDDETISVNLSRLAPNVKSLVFTINSFRGQTFNEVANCFARLVNKSNNSEICRYTLSEKGGNTAMVMAKVYRHNGEWKVAALGAPSNGSTINEMVNDIRAVL